MLSALCYFSLCSTFLPGSSCHLSTSTSSEMFRRSDRCWAGSIRESDLGRLMHANTQTDTLPTKTPPLLHSGLLASTLIDLHLLYQTDSSLLLSSSTSLPSVWLRILKAPDHAQDVYISNLPPPPTPPLSVLFQSFSEMDANIPSQPMCNLHSGSEVRTWQDIARDMIDRIYIFISRFPQKIIGWD